MTHATKAIYKWILADYIKVFQVDMSGTIECSVGGVRLLENEWKQ